MNFFETSAGHRFCEGTLPQLVEEIEKLNENFQAESQKKQYVEAYPLFRCGDRIQEELDKGAEVVSMVTTEKQVIVVFKK